MERRREGGESERDRQSKINGRTWCTWIVIRYDMRVNGCSGVGWVGSYVRV